MTSRLETSTCQIQVRTKGLSPFHFFSPFFLRSGASHFQLCYIYSISHMGYFKYFRFRFAIAGVTTNVILGSPASPDRFCQSEEPRFELVSFQLLSYIQQDNGTRVNSDELSSSSTISCINKTTICHAAPTLVGKTVVRIVVTPQVLQQASLPSSLYFSSWRIRVFRRRRTNSSSVLFLLYFFFFFFFIFFPLSTFLLPFVAAAASQRALLATQNGVEKPQFNIFLYLLHI